MCKLLRISRSIVYYQKKQKLHNTKLENEIISIFRKSRNNYGTRKIKAELRKKGFTTSRKTIQKVMQKYSLVSNYTVKKYKPSKAKPNKANIENIVNREFNDRYNLEVVVSDLTYINISGKWNYICLLVDLFNREIIGYSVGNKKDANLVKDAFLSTSINLSKVVVFHTDRGSEFNNRIINEILHAFKIKRSLSKVGSPHDNAVAESTYKTLKTEFVGKNQFSSLWQVKVQLGDYVNWYNNHRIHGTLGYKTPVEYRKNKAITCDNGQKFSSEPLA